MIVKTGFFCIKEKKTYKQGDVYTGDRTDINHLMIEDIDVVDEKVIKPSKKRK
jgi:hypothetical protein